ncbi:hypothetical protein ACFYV5_20290 [Streptomyces sp. NPDC003035]|uniref:hypothetical protein n=1 Tax=unclassified Streptomyces TaxID=2593676 RepID=UPI0033B21DB2
MNPHRKIRSSPVLRTGLSRPVQGGLSVAALVIIPLLAIGGSDGFRAALDFTSGVLSLVSLTASVAWGLIATDRLLLSPRHRLIAQGVHRATAVASLGFLLLHGTVKVSLGHVEPIGALIPFGLGITGTSALIGFGSLAGLLMVVTASTGALRSTLAGRSRFAARWRPLHMLAYPAWCFALVHGLYAGRPAATWVVVMYCLALTAVAAAVSLRLLPAPTQRELADRLAGLLASLESTARSTRSTRSHRSARGDDPAGRANPAEAAAGAEEEDSGHERPTMSAEWLDRPAGHPPLPPLASVPPPVPSSRLYAPPPPPCETAPPLHETAPPAPPAVPTTGPVSSAGFSAAYRAVSRATPAPDPAPHTPHTPHTPHAPYASGGAPLAERIPMTEEIPVVPDPSPRPGFWPTPSPPMPTYSSPPPAGEPWTAPAGDRP